MIKVKAKKNANKKCKMKFYYENGRLIGSILYQDNPAALYYGKWAWSVNPISGGIFSNYVHTKSEAVSELFANKDLSFDELVEKYK